MGNFDENKYKTTDYAKEINQARQDLESDYPGGRVFINFADGGSPSVRCIPISLLPPDGQTSIISGHFELPGKIFGTEGYDYHVFSEGTLEYDGKFGEGWTSQSDGGQETSESTWVKKFIAWRRKDGGTKIRNKTTVDAANWMKDLDGELYLSALTIPGTHDSHSLVGTPLMPNSDSWNPMDHALDGIVDLYSKATTAAETQDWDIATQLRNGIRYLDFRYGYDLGMRHGQMRLPGTLPQCLKVVSDFLDSSPQETVIVMAKWDVWDFITNKGHDEPDTVKAAADKAFTDLTRFLNTTAAPQLKDARGKIVRKKEGNSSAGIDFSATKRDAKYDQPAFVRPEYQLSNFLTPQQNEWAEQAYTIAGVWAQAEATLNWIKDVRPKALSDAIAKDNAETDPTKKNQNVKAVNSVWDNTGLNSFRMDVWTVVAHTTLFPVTMAKPTNTQLRKWLDLNCAVSQRYELGVVQLDFAGSEGTALITKLILANFT